jgi:hypothetical protein
MELTNWLELSDRGGDLIPCLDFPGGRAAAGFGDLAAGVAGGDWFLHVRQAGAGPLAARFGRWADELLATGRPVRAVLGFCTGSAMATRLADAIAATGSSAPPPMVVLFDAVPATGASLTGQFTLALESNARHLTADEQADAQDLSEQLVEKYPDDLPRIAAALTERYDRLMRAVASRLSLHELLRQELTSMFTAYLDYLMLASEGGFDMRSSTPLFLTSPDYEPPVEGARTVAFDIVHDDLLRDPEVHQFVADLLKGEHPW